MSYYTVAQYVPTLDERLNFGLIVLGDGRVRSRFLDDWSRIRAYAGHEVDFLIGFAAGFRDEEIGEDAMRRVVAEWGGSIRFTPLRGSLLGVDELFADCSERYFGDGSEVRP